MCRYLFCLLPRSTATAHRTGGCRAPTHTAHTRAQLPATANTLGVKHTCATPCNMRQRSFPVHCRWKAERACSLCLALSTQAARCSRVCSGIPSRNCCCNRCCKTRQPVRQNCGTATFSSCKWAECAPMYRNRCLHAAQNLFIAMLGHRDAQQQCNPHTQSLPSQPHGRQLPK